MVGTPSVAHSRGKLALPTIRDLFSSLRHRLAQRGDLEMVLVVADGGGDEARSDRRAVIVQDRHQPHRIDAVLVDDQLSKLAVAVLLDHVNKIMPGNEARDA